MASDPVTQLRLTPTELAAREARADDALARRSAGDRVWQPVAVAALRPWIEQQWLRQWPSEQLLSGPPLLALWQQIIEGDERPLLAPQQCARLAMAADQMARRHGLDPARMPAYTEEHQAFRRWRRQLDTQLAALGAITPADLPDRIDPAAAPQTIDAAGVWTALPPREQALLTRLGVTLPAGPPPPAPEAAWTFADADSQYRGLAEALRGELLAAEDRPLRILLAINDPNGQGLLDAALGDALAPWRHQIGEAGLLPWRWAQPRPLSDTAWARAWLQVAQLHRGSLPFGTLSSLLLNPALWSGAQAMEAACLESRLRQAAWPQLDLDGLAHLAERQAATLAPALQRLAIQLGREPGRATPGDWHTHFAARMSALHGDATAPDDSLRFQIRRATRLAAGRLGSLDRLLGTVSAATAARWLQEWLDAPFQPRVEHPQPLLVGTPETLVGIPCDLLVIADATSDALPGRAPLNPFLPVDAQRAAGIAAAHPQQWLQQRQATLAALRSSARRCWLARPNVDDRGAPSLPCPWLQADWADRAAPPAPRRHRLPTLPDEDPVPAVAAAEAMVASAGLFERMLHAPLLALCVDRLGTQPLPPPPRGLSARLQGTLLHEALAIGWGQLRTSTALQRLDAGSIAALATEAVDAALPALLPPRRFGAAWVALERQRAIDLLCAWFHHEQRRQAPFTVIARELPLEGQLDGLPVRLRLDRADRVDTAQGPQVLLLDYKTGRDAQPRGWDADRLEAPQLPLYAVLAARQPDLQPLGGIGFAHLKEGHPALSARTTWTTRLIDAPEHPPDPEWPAVLAAWRHRLGAAAQAFLRGEAGADPTVLTRHLAPYRALLLDAGDDDGEGAPS